MYFFTADEHYFHANIIKYCSRPFKNVEEMNETLINNHNSVVKQEDITVHVGDFAFGLDVSSLLYRLNGKHIFIKGSHDKWSKHSLYLCEFNIENQLVCACHYAMRTWPRSHYNSWLVFGHSHGRLEPFGKSYDVGVDNNNFYPVSFEKLGEIMSELPDNFNLVKK